MPEYISCIYYMLACASYMWSNRYLADIATATLSLPWPCPNTTSVWPFYRSTVAPGPFCLLPFYRFTVAGRLCLLPFYRFTVAPGHLFLLPFYRRSWSPLPFTVLPFYRSTGTLPHRTTRKQKTYTTLAQTDTDMETFGWNWSSDSEGC